jgi:hypothetical protein
VNSWLDANYKGLSDDEVIKHQQTVSSGKNQIVSITEYDVKTLEPGICSR